MSKRGGSKGRQKPSLATLSRQFLQQEHLDGFTAELRGESDRAAALVVGAALEQMFANIIKNRLRVGMDDKDLNVLFYDRNAPLGTFSSRILMAYALGLISEEERDHAECVRRIRNAFAHTVVPIGFEEPLVAKECLKLTIGGPEDRPEYWRSPRLRYLYCALFLTQKFATLRERFLNEETRATWEWDEPIEWEDDPLDWGDEPSSFPDTDDL